jgi:hypothetical protein
MQAIATPAGSDVVPTEEPKKPVKWSYDNEEIIAVWADQGKCLAWMYHRTHKYYANLNAWYTIPAIIFSTISGTASFAQASLPVEYQVYAPMLIGTINIVIGILTTIQQYLKIGELKESNKILAVAWDKFARNIAIELAKAPDERLDAGHFLKFSRQEFDRLMESGNAIPSHILRKFKSRFRGKTPEEKENYDMINKPDVCDVIVSINANRHMWFTRRNDFYEPEDPKEYKGSKDGMDSSTPTKRHPRIYDHDHNDDDDAGDDYNSTRSSFHEFSPLPTPLPTPRDSKIYKKRQDSLQKHRIAAEKEYHVTQQRRTDMKRAAAAAAAADTSADTSTIPKSGMISDMFSFTHTRSAGTNASVKAAPSPSSHTQLPKKTPKLSLVNLVNLVAENTQPVVETDTVLVPAIATNDIEEGIQLEFIEEPSPTEAYTSFLRGSEATPRLEPTSSVLDPASSPQKSRSDFKVGSDFVASGPKGTGLRPPSLAPLGSSTKSQV